MKKILRYKYYLFQRVSTYMCMNAGLVYLHSMKFVERIKSIATNVSNPIIGKVSVKQFLYSNLQ